MFVFFLVGSVGAATADSSLLVYKMTNTFLQASPVIGIFKPTDPNTSKIFYTSVMSLRSPFMYFRLFPKDFFPLGDTMSKDQNAMMVRDSGNGLVSPPTSFT